MWCSKAHLLKRLRCTIWTTLHCQKIKLLEAKLGVQLLNRSTRSFALTPAGEEILAQAHILVDTLDQINSIADSYQSQPKGILRITSPVYFGQLYLQPIITQFMQRYPQVKISLILDDKKQISLAIILIWLFGWAS